VGNIRAEIIEPQQYTPPPSTVDIYTQYVVLKWRKMHGYCFADLVMGSTKTEYQGQYSPGIITIPIDPLTAISLRLVTPEDLEYPPGILAAFNLLSKEPS
jgi:hypothetical protein